MKVASFNSAKWRPRSPESLLLPSMTKIHCYCLCFLSRWQSHHIQERENTTLFWISRLDNPGPAAHFTSA